MVKAIGCQQAHLRYSIDVGHPCILTLVRLTFRIPQQSGGEVNLPPPPFYFHYIVDIYNILYIFEKLSFMPFRIWKKNNFLQNLRSNYLQHMKKTDYYKNLANFIKPCIKSSQFFYFFFFGYRLSEKRSHVFE